VVAQLLLFLLITGMAASCEPKLLVLQLRKGWGVLAGVCCHFLFMPFLGFLCSRGEPPVTAVTLLIVTTSPSGGFSGLWCSLCNADLALSVAVTTASTLVSCGMLPLNLYLYVGRLSGRSVAIDWAQVTISVVVVVSAVATGLSCAVVWPSWRAVANKAGSAAGVALMVFSAFASTTSHDPIWTKPFTWFLACSLPCLAGLCLSFTLSRLLRLPPPEATTVAIECVYQNTAMALSIALSAFPQSDAGMAASVTLVYGLAEICFIACFALCAWQLGQTYAPRTDGFCTVLLGNYQPQDTPPDSTANTEAADHSSSGTLDQPESTRSSWLPAMSSRTFFQPMIDRFRHSLQVRQRIDPDTYGALSAPLATSRVEPSADASIARASSIPERAPAENLSQS